MRASRAILVLSLLLCVGGCASYEYDLTQPADLRRHVGTKTDTVVPIDPLEYRLRTVDNRLVMRIFNPTDEAIQLIGERSTVVDPDGQSHPLRAQTIAPHSFIKLVLPPLKPYVYDPGPTFGFGVGTHVGSAYGPYYSPFYSPYYYPYYSHYWYGAPYGPTYYEPRYFYVYDEGDNRYWDWKGETDARMTLVFARGEKQFTHELAFHRKKM